MTRLVFPFLLFASCLQAATPTNFIQILTDDQGWGDLKSYGHVQLKTPHIDQLAADGYAALAVDMYDGKSANDASEARELMSKVGKDQESALHNLRQAYAYLKDVIKSERVGVIGWCFGGGWSLQAAINFGNDLNAAVIYYGRVSSDGNDLRAIDSPLLGIFGSEDGGIPIETVRNFEAELTKLEKDITINIYKSYNIFMII